MGSQVRTSAKPTFMLILFYFQLMGRVNRIINEYFETKPVLDPASPGITLSSFTRTCSMKKNMKDNLVIVDLTSQIKS